MPHKIVVVGARSSPLSRIQAEEVLTEIQQHYPQVSFVYHFVETYGDKDRKTSLRELNKTDFFTREIDNLLLQGSCRVGIHSAKDLPDPLTRGLVLAALTQGLDSFDVLVMPPGMTLSTLPPGALIATSSERREQMVLQLRSDLRFTDIRGGVDERLKKLERGEIDGLVVAEAALIRLRLTHLNRQVLPGETVPGQGQLAIIVREDDEEMKQLFQILDSRV